VTVGRSRLVAVTLVLASTAASRLARADEPYRLAWSRAEGADACLSESELSERVRSRLGREPFDDRAERTIEGQVGLNSSGGFLAQLVIRAADSTVLGRRTIETQGPDCGPLGQAVTLAVVLTIDPTAPLDDVPSNAESPTTAGPPTEMPVARARMNSAPAPVAPEPAPPPRVPVARPPGAAPARAALGAGVVGALGLLPRAALGVELEGTYPAPSGFLVGARMLPSVETPDGHLGVAVTSGKLGFCGGIPKMGSLSLCGAFEAGVTSVVARDLVPVSPGDYPFLALAAGARFVLPSRGPLGLQVGVWALLPLYTQRFQVRAANARDYQASEVAGVLSLGVRLGG
jgi:hypothetical protein